ncbi:MAG: hypothetical protein H0X26_10290 [Alphaproteobacteria bacterium]|nr:hypothetical protein [Alphaproteobacteria bacterium]
MSDNTINHSPASLKHINTRLEKMGCLADRLDVLAYRYQRFLRVAESFLSSTLSLPKCWIKSIVSPLKSGRNIPSSWRNGGLKILPYKEGQGASKIVWDKPTIRSSAGSFQLVDGAGSN